mmetsp:Transcript_31162/g.56922  ORF Transcript_31162/g.56922 Transcript_31162/m.56922 type:complete len:201 (-) Transcript_31162:783-1385(-)
MLAWLLMRPRAEKFSPSASWTQGARRSRRAWVATTLSWQSSVLTMGGLRPLAGERFPQLPGLELSRTWILSLGQSTEQQRLHGRPTWSSDALALAARRHCLASSCRVPQIATIGKQRQRTRAEMSMLPLLRTIGPRLLRPHSQVRRLSITSSGVVLIQQPVKQSGMTGLRQVCSRLDMLLGQAFSPPSLLCQVLLLEGGH